MKQEFKSDQELVFHIETSSMEEFEQAARLVKELGGTHMMVGDLPRSHWMWDMDRTDPYSNWSMGHAQFFKVICPPELEPYLPQEHIRRCHELVAERCRILDKIGLKGAFYSNEPFWLPEAVYRDHPNWRGARCDHPRRSRKPYYSPNIDDPEVLSMYRYAMKQLCRETGIDFFIVMSNDSGGGISWSAGTYAGPNGPMSVRKRPMSDRICGYMDALTEGAKEGGVNPVIHLNANIDFKDREAAIDAVWPLLKEGQVVNDRDCHGNRPISCFANPFQCKPPVTGIPQMIAFCRYMQKAADSGSRYLVLDIPKTDMNEAECYLKLLKEKGQAEDMAEGLALLKECAAELAGTEAASRLLDAWYHIDESFTHLRHTGLDLMMYGCQHQRWINRPFVLYPEELTEEEYGYYRPYQFQALTPERANDLLDMQGIEGVRGFTAVFMLTQTMMQAENSLDQAVQLLGQAVEAAAETAKEPLKMLIRRLKAQKCFFRNIVNAAQFQELADRTDFTAEPQLSLRWPTRNDRRVEEFQNISRSEIENVLELADLLEGYETELLTMVTEEEKEDIFYYGPHIVEQLRKKADTMWNHMLDANRVYETHNI